MTKPSTEENMNTTSVVAMVTPIDTTPLELLSVTEIQLMLKAHACALIELTNKNIFCDRITSPHVVNGLELQHVVTISGVKDSECDPAHHCTVTTTSC